MRTHTVAECSMDQRDDSRLICGVTVRMRMLDFVTLRFTLLFFQPGFVSGNFPTEQNTFAAFVRRSGES